MVKGPTPKEGRVVARFLMPPRESPHSSHRTCMDFKRPAKLTQRRSELSLPPRRPLAAQEEDLMDLPALPQALQAHLAAHLLDTEALLMHRFHRTCLTTGKITPT